MIAVMCHSLVILFCASIGFLLAGLGFQKMTEDVAFRQAGQMVSLVGLSFQLVVIGALVTLLAMLAGALPIVVAVIRFALARKRTDILLKLSVPFPAFAVFFLAVLFLQSLDHPGVQAGWLLFLYRGVFLSAFPVVTIVSVGAVCRAVVRSEISEKLLHFAMLPAILLTFSMALILAAIIVWGFGLHAGAPQLFVSNDGLVGTSTTSTWLGIVITMSIATGCAILSLLRGLSARSTLHNIETGS